MKQVFLVLITILLAAILFFPSSILARELVQGVVTTAGSVTAPSGRYIRPSPGGRYFRPYCRDPHSRSCVGYKPTPPPSPKAPNCSPYKRNCKPPEGH
ncbi:hypothetical protein PanWU01x14_296360 [Parasponia andersonii]|uniref:Rapid ALkalinization Factor n=1 Tax=Parasponia andersonii TaxID=3476 RepID=A0A2P5AVP2_PARAD|nr:hypothetical protein PanWU01x14_296360 [Parasponia andersonii]